MTASHSRILPLIFLILLFFDNRLVSASESLWFSPCAESDGLSFASGFDDVSVVDNDDGSDASITAKTKTNCKYDEKSSKSGVRFGNLSIQYDGGGKANRLASITSDPIDPNNNVLLFDIQKPNVMGKRGLPVKGRAQMNVYNNKNIKHFKMSVRLFLPVELQLLTDYPEKIDWLTISEWWNNAPWTKQLYPFRITVNLFKDSGKAPIVFQAHAQTYTIESKQWNEDIWELVNRDFNIPFGKWMTLEYEFIEGDKFKGRFLMAVTPEGGKRTIVFDVHNLTYHPDDPEPDGLAHFNPLKLYTSVKVINYLSNQGGSLRVYWDDIAFKAFAN